MDKSSTKSENNKNAETVLKWESLPKGTTKMPSGYKIVYARGERSDIKGQSALYIIKMLELKAMELMKKGEKVQLISRKLEHQPGCEEMVYYLLVREEKTPRSKN